MTPCGSNHEPPLATAIAAWVDVTCARKERSVSSWMAWPHDRPCRVHVGKPRLVCTGPGIATWARDDGGDRLARNGVAMWANRIRTCNLRLRRPRLGSPKAKSV